MCAHSLLLLPLLYVVPGEPQDVTLSEQVVTSVFVAWRPPPGHEEGYKVNTGKRKTNTVPDMA